MPESEPLLEGIHLLIISVDSVGITRANAILYLMSKPIKDFSTVESACAGDCEPKAKVV